MYRMNDTRHETDEPPSTAAPVALRENANGGKNGNSHNGKAADNGGLFKIFKTMFRSKNDTSLREAIEEYIEEQDSESDINESVESIHEKHLLSNILRLRDLKVVDVMIPRADIIAIDINTTKKDLLTMLSEKQHSRLPVYRDSLDDVVGTIHIKDILQCLAEGRKFNIAEMVRDVPIVSPSMAVLDLILMMRQMRKHMALVVDEFGGIDGLIAIGDVIEEIVGEIDDEYDEENEPEIVECKDGSILIDARYDIEDFEEKYGELLTEEEREDVDTLGGLVSSIAGRVPVRGEIISHEDSGTVFEIMDADPRRVNRLRIKNIPLSD